MKFLHMFSILASKNGEYVKMSDFAHVDLQKLLQNLHVINMRFQYHDKPKFTKSLKIAHVVGINCRILNKLTL